MVRRAYAGAAVPTTLASGISNIDTAATVVALTGYPSGSSKWYAVIDKGEVTEEKVLVTQVSGFVVTITRGADGTTGQAHSAGATFEHCFTATDADEANAHVVATGDTHGLPIGADFVGTTGVQTLEDKSISGLTNTLSAIPSSASPAIVALIDAVQADLDAEVAGITVDLADRYTKSETDTRYVNTGGDTLTGALLLAANPTVALGAAPKQYVDKWVPVGSVVMWPNQAIAAPTGWLLCDGSAVNRTTYANLFALMGTTYGVGDGSTTFNLPNFAGMFPRGTGVAPTLDLIEPGDNGGNEVATILEANLPAHTHDISHEHGVLYGGGSGGATRRLVSTADFTSSASLAGQTSITPDSTSGTGSGSGADLDLMNPWMAINFIIRATTT